MLPTCAMRDIALVYSVSRIGWWPVIHAGHAPYIVSLYCLWTSSMCGRDITGMRDRCGAVRCQRQSLGDRLVTTD
jgi:hypothetical protein